jgi:uncharacterized Zn finger protein
MAPDTSRRVAIALWEDDVDGAWEAVKRGQCQQSLRISLAKRMRAIHPNEAIDLYCGLVHEIVQEGHNFAYRDAVGLVRDLRNVMVERGQLPQFAIYLAELHRKFKSKRNFIKLLDGGKLPP